MFYLNLFAGWTTLDNRRHCLILGSVSEATRVTRTKHWSCYLQFCKLYSLCPLPCSLRQAGNYLSFLSLYMKQASVITYYQAVRFFSKLFQLDCPLLSHPHLRAILNGVLNSPGSSSVPKAAFLVQDLKLLKTVVCVKIDVHLLVWSAVLLMFRTLLRVSHVVDSPHCITRGDVAFYDWGLVLSIHSSKTRKPTAQCVKLPVVKSSGTDFCPVFWVHYLFLNHPLGQNAPLFSTSKLSTLSYSMFSRTFKLTKV